MAIDTETMQIIERVVARAVANATSLKGAADKIANGVTQYVGARYVPLFAEPLEWDKTKAYDPLTIVLHQGNSYTSRQYVPVGVEIDNDSFWALTGNYNAQVEQYRQEVKTFDGRITANANAIDKESRDRADAVSAENTRAEDEEQTLQANIDAEKTRAEGAEHTLQANIDAEKTRAEGAEHTLQANIDSVKKLSNIHESIAVFIGDSWTAGYTDHTGSGFVEIISGFGIFGSVKNYGIGGAGYIPGDNKTTFAQIADNVIENESRVDYIFINGGVNDTGNSADAMSAAAGNVFSKLHTAFPNAIIYVSANTLPAMNYEQLNAPLNKAKEMGFAAIFGLAERLLYKDWFTSDEYHVNHTGHLYIAQMLMAKFYGMDFPALNGYWNFPKTAPYITNIHDGITITDDVFNTINRSGNLISLHISFNVTSMSKNDVLFNINRSLLPVYNNINSYPDISLNSNYAYTKEIVPNLAQAGMYVLKPNGDVVYVRNETMTNILDSINLQWTYDHGIITTSWYNA